MASSCVLELAGSLHTDVVLKVSLQHACQLAQHCWLPPLAGSSAVPAPGSPICTAPQ